MSTLCCSSESALWYAKRSGLRVVQQNSLNTEAQLSMLSFEVVIHPHPVIITWYIHITDHLLVFSLSLYNSQPRRKSSLSDLAEIISSSESLLYDVLMTFESDKTKTYQILKVISELLVTWVMSNSEILVCQFSLCYNALKTGNFQKMLTLISSILKHRNVDKF